MIMSILQKHENIKENPQQPNKIKEWCEYIDENDRLIVKNNFTEQQFQFFSQVKMIKNNIKNYLLRELQAVNHHLPRLIVLEKLTIANKNKSKETYKQSQLSISLLVERGERNILEWLDEGHCELMVMIRLREMVYGVEYLYRKYGGFLVTERMIKLGGDGNLLIWYNERFQVNMIQLPLTARVSQNCDRLGMVIKISDEQIMIQNLIGIFRRSVRRLNHQIIGEFVGVRTFEEIKGKIKEKIKRLEDGMGKNMGNKKAKSIKSSKSMKSGLEVRRFEGMNKHNWNSKKYSFSQQQSEQFFIHHNDKRSSFPVGLHFLYKKDVSGESNSSNTSKKQQQSSNRQTKKIINSFSFSDLGQNSNKTIKMQKNNNNNDERIKIVIRTEGNQCVEQNQEVYLEQKNREIKQNKEKTIINQNSQIKLSFKKKHKTDSTYSNLLNLPYKAGDSFSSKKNFSLKSTTGTIGTLFRRTGEFQDNLKQIMFDKRETIKQESDENYKNSAEYSPRQSVQSKTISEEMNKLFSAKNSAMNQHEGSFGSELQLLRQREFEKVLFQ